MPEPVNILDLRDSPWVDGPGRTVLQTAASLDRRRYNVIIGGFCGEDVSGNIYLTEARNRNLDICPIVEKASLDLNAVRQIMTTIDKLNIGMLHTHDFRSNLAGLYCAWRKNLPVVSTCHGWIANDFKRSLYRSVDIRLLRRFDRVITVSALMKRQLVAAGLARDKVEVVVNALVIDDYHPDSGDKRFRRELGIDDACILLVNIGRLSAEKGQALLLDAFRDIHREDPLTRLVYVGIGPEERPLTTLATELGLEHAVTFAGYRSDMTSVYNSADLVVQSSFTEGMPNVILESLLMETPVIATDVGGTAEIVEHGVSGYLVAANSKSQLAGGIRDFLENSGRHLEMAKRGRRRIAADFNHDSRVEHCAALYSSVLSGRAH